MLDLGIDLGNRMGKVCSKFGDSSYEARFRELSKEELDNMFGMASNIFQFEGKYYRPEDGTYQIKSRKIDRKDIRLNFAYALAQYAKDGDKINVGVCLPIKQYNDDKDKLKALLLNDPVYKFIYKGEAVEVEVVNLTIVPEAIASFFSLDEKLLESRGSNDLTIVDIGGKTTDGCVIDKFNSPINSITEQCGAFDLYEKIISDINNAYPDACLDIFEAEDIIKEKEFFLAGNKINVSDLVQSSLINHSNQISSKIVQFNRKLTRNMVVVVGGHGKEIFNLFKSEIKHSVLHNTPFYANAKGCYEYVARKFKK